MPTLRLSSGPAALLLALAAAWLTSAVSLPAATDAKPSGKLPSYKLRPMDLVKIQVFQEPDLDRELRVSQDNTIVAPLIGAVDVKNRTVRDVELFIAKLYTQGYLVNPQINLTVMEYAQRTVNVFGAVNTPGSITIPPEKVINLLDAVARAGGFSRLANRTNVSLTRTLPNGQQANYTVNTDQLVTGDAKNRYQIQDGDVIFVPERVF
ncbi:MAG: polysaccharide export outer membrane protein [Verrucomicrobia bacterium]|nr:MAG: polysaccharide export outer membrane protein [Verrucomicrobiota bacterium]